MALTAEAQSSGESSFPPSPKLLRKVFHWEYWPASIANLPVALIWFWYALRARDPFFFTTVNPAVSTGGLFGESKLDILRQMPEALIPVTVLAPRGAPWVDVREKLVSAGLSYPLIAKPNVGERGFLVAKLDEEEALREHLQQYPVDFLLQEFIDYPEEASVFHYRLPNGAGSAVTSLCLKKHLTVSGDGRSNIRELMQRSLRAHLQLARFEREFPRLLEEVPAAGKEVLLEPIGNHCRGTMFLDGSRHIDPPLTAVFDEISRHFQGIYYGRFDIKYTTLEELRKGRGLKILEFNGVAGEPAHIYDPAIPVWKKYRSYYRHWGHIYRIYRQQRAKGVKPMTFSEMRAAYSDYRSYMQDLRKRKV